MAIGRTKRLAAAQNAGNRVDASVAAEPSVGMNYEMEVVWWNVVKFTILHFVALYGLLKAPNAMPLTLFWHFLYYFPSALGITAGVHRLWSHRAYKAKTPLRILLACFNSMAFENSVYEWARDHRVHHKWTDTNADPHNCLRGFFFCHVGWLMVRKHPDVARMGKTLNFDDLHEDPVVMFQHKHKYAMMMFFTFILPTAVPLLWGEDVGLSFLLATLRYTCVLNFTWSVNSFAHMFGTKPYDKTMTPVENNIVAVLAAGEGFHNFHHTFPKDYATSELGLKLNMTTRFLHFMHSMGQAYDLMRTSEKVVRDRIERTGGI